MRADRVQALGFFCLTVTFVFLGKQALLHRAVSVVAIPSEQNLSPLYQPETEETFLPEGWVWADGLKSPSSQQRSLGFQLVSFSKPLSGLQLPLSPVQVSPPLLLDSEPPPFSPLLPLQSLSKEALSLISQSPDHIPDLFPVTGLITSGFGVRALGRRKNKGKKGQKVRAARLHKGVDISVPKGTPVLASASGIVKQAFYHPSYGWIVVVEHANGLTTKYAHNSKLLVTPGQPVVKGAVLALSGNSGRTWGRTGNHVHFEVWFRGAPYDPQQFLAKDHKSIQGLLARLAGDKRRLSTSRVL